MKKLVIATGDGGVPHVVYDLSIEPVEKRIKKAMIFPSANDTAAFLGISAKKLVFNRSAGKRIVGPDGKLYAVRIAKKV